MDTIAEVTVLIRLWEPAIQADDLDGILARHFEDFAARSRSPAGDGRCDASKTR